MAISASEDPKKTAKMTLHFVTGKGGVGKSAVAAALALRLANSGKKCLLVELGNQSFYKDYFNLPSLTYNSVNLRPNLDVAMWSGPECLKEYARHLLKIESLYQLFFENPVSKALLNIAPALPELAILGKITSGPPRNVGPAMPYDCIVVDAYATGHFLALMRAPSGMSQAVKFGPMGEQSRAIHRVISNPEFIKYYVVSTPEEMPISEALELSQSLESQVGLRPIQILNRVLPAMTHGQNNSENAEFKKAMELHQANVETARKRFADFQSWELPFVLKNKAWSIVDALSESLPNENVPRGSDAG